MMGKEMLDELLASRGGIITSKMATENGIHREYLNEYVRKGKLERVTYGVFITPELLEDKPLIYQLRKNKLIYSHETALYLHDLTDRDPVRYAVTVPNGYNISKLNKDDFVIHTVKKELFSLGLGIMKSPHGNDIRVYDMERTICDILRDRHHQDPAVLSDALKRYARNQDKNLNTLMKYAAPMRIEKVLRTYLEVLL
jgi:predicted transcriptional regulator of viral defense system